MVQDNSSKESLTKHSENVRHSDRRLRYQHWWRGGYGERERERERERHRREYILRWVRQEGMQDWLHLACYESRVG